MNSPNAPAYLVELTGSPTCVAEELELVTELAQAHDATGIKSEDEPEARARLWKARHAVGYATAALMVNRLELNPMS